MPFGRRNLNPVRLPIPPLVPGGLGHLPAGMVLVKRSLRCRRPAGAFPDPNPTTTVTVRIHGGMQPQSSGPVPHSGNEASLSPLPPHPRPRGAGQGMLSRVLRGTRHPAKRLRGDRDGRRWESSISLRRMPSDHRDWAMSGVLHYPRLPMPRNLLIRDVAPISRTGVRT